MRFSVYKAAAAFACMSVITAFTAVSVYAAEIPSGVKVGGINVGGMTVEEARNAVEDHLDKVRKKSIILDTGEKKSRLSGYLLDYDWADKDDVFSALENISFDKNIIERYKDAADGKGSSRDIQVQVVYDKAKADAWVEKVCDIPASEELADATITKTEEGFVITPEKSIVRVDVEGTKNRLYEIIEGLSDAGQETKLELAGEITRPEVTEKMLSQIKDLLGTYTTDFSTSSDARATNLRRGTSLINGHTVMPGQTLSGYECMAPIDASNGFKVAHAYENGRTVDAVGGGACQIASTLYNASLRAELTITQRSNHSLQVTYVPPSADAAIAGTYKDIKITNPYDTPIYVEGITEGTKLTFNIWGAETRPANRTLEFESKTLSHTDCGVQEIQDPTLAPGQRVKVAGGYNGRVSQLWKIVKVDGAETDRIKISQDYYQASPSIYRVGVSAPVTETAPVPVEGPGGGPGVGPGVQPQTSAGPGAAGPGAPAQSTGGPGNPGQDSSGPVPAAGGSAGPG